MQIHKARNILLLTRHCERRKVRGNPFSFKGNTDSFALCAQNDTPFSYHECRKVYAVSCCLVIAVRVSGGHLCEAEAPTEPAGETAARRVAIRSSTFVIAKPRKRLWQSVSLSRGLRILSRSALRMTKRRRKHREKFNIRFINKLQDRLYVGLF